MAFVDCALVTAAKEFVGVPSVYELFSNPIPPIQSSFAWVVVGVMPVKTVALLPVALLVWSSDEAVSTPLYSRTMAAERSEACVTTSEVPALETLGAYQISVVVPLALAACAARAQTAPACVRLVTRPALVPRVEITAMSVFPSVGEGRVTLKEVTALVPEFPVALFTRSGAPPRLRIVCNPTSLPASTALPDNVRFVPSELFEIVKSLAAAAGVPS